MKTLHLIRHAKSSWDNPRLSDQHRPLNSRGRKDAVIMAKALDDVFERWPKVFCSPATRARETITTIAENWAGDAFDWQVVDDLYEFSASNLISWLSTALLTHDELLLVGHNPAFTNLINHLSDADLANFPTCAYAKLTFEDIEAGGGAMACFLKPKMFK
ncbi:histidine phosphatase family protein [Marinicella sp. S1101]|uniref:SixA phosphatase family protein n=1 Tax=Marinicella marina TaxID=2996016 RepID=UPI002260F3AB|nr:histidine phosphatase family protein [Marinicella marina]MCX7553043.1 histidine phosphatase family protein [Marinicella marina]MDJ1139597.1 histidine phosphatase family protein [Marinicella marina]